MTARTAPTAGELRHRLRSGGQVRSTFVKTTSREILDLLAFTALDAVVIDLEHSQLDEGQARVLVRHAALVGLAPIVRVPGVDRGEVNRLLEAGAVGIQLSTLRSCEQVRSLVEVTRYAPEGARSISLAQPAAHYGRDGLDQHLRANHGGPLLIGQIETATTDDPLEELLGPLDVAFLGLTDLSVDLGAAGRFDAPALVEAVGRVAAAVRATPSVVLGGWVPSYRDADLLLTQGARYLTEASDLALIAAALTDRFGRFPEPASTPPST